MTLKKILKAKSENTLLTPDIAKKVKNGKVLGNFAMKTTKFSKNDDDKKLFMDIDTSDGKFTWVLNPTSSDYLIDTLSDDENTWIGKTIEFDISKQVVEGKVKDVIYAKGAI